MNRSIFKDYLFTKNDTNLDHDFIRRLCGGFALSKIDGKVKIERRKFLIRLEMCRLEWYKPMPGYEEFEGCIDFRDIQEIRIVDDDIILNENHINPDSKMFIILYGKKFCLRKLSCIADVIDPEKLKHLFEYIKNIANWAPFRAQVDILLSREFEEYSSQRKQQCKAIYLKDLKHYICRHHLKLSSADLKKIFYEVDHNYSGYLEFDGFVSFYNKITNRRSITDLSFLKALLKQYTEDSKKITILQLKNFFTNEQKIKTTYHQLSDIVLRNSLDSLRHYETNPYFTRREFVDYLFSKENSIWNEFFSDVTQDMNQPLNHYWIASSHNTYLTGDQFKSESSIECYIRCLRLGCRCVEYCWDGPDGKPVIYHGRTLTTKIQFVDVIQCIKKHAFDVSPYPVILSIENHCSIKQQKFMAKYLVEILGDLLLKKPIDFNEVCLPSPEQLKRKIIIKHKKNRFSLDSNNNNLRSSEKSFKDRDNDIDNSIKSGNLFIYFPNEQRWRKHFVILTTKKLNYILDNDDNDINVSKDDDDDANETSYGSIGDKDNFYSFSMDSPRNELHFGESWFHGKMKCGRLEAEKILYKNLSLGDGTFLVRESETHPGDYTLSFLYQNTAHHSRIKLDTQTNGTKTYRLNDLISFNTLYELIEYYQTKPLKSDKFQELFLQQAAPQINTHEHKPWFYKNLSKEKAEDILKRLRHNGAFLVRHSEQQDNQYSISFRAENNIKHCRIKKEGRLYMIGNEEFESLTELIEFYEKNPLYRRTKLLFPATQENVRILGGEPTDSPSSYMEHGSINFDQTKVVVLYDYTARSSNELSLTVGNIIKDVIKHDNGWWRGVIQSKTGYFPSNFVTEIFEDTDESSTNEIESYKSIDLDNHNVTISIYSSELNSFKIGSIIFMATNDFECQDWMTKIQDVLNRKAKSFKESKRFMKIASELNDLVIYCCSAGFDGKLTNYREMCSIRECKIEKQLTINNYRNIMNYTRHQLMRVYPEGTRIYSSNYNPIPMWNCGVQMVSLNYQTKDKPMQLYHAKFMQNGNCGYVLMPKYMNLDEFNPFTKPDNFDFCSPIVLNIKIICAKNLRKLIKGILSPSVEVEVIGTEFDSKKYATNIIYDNGLCPTWSDDEFVFHITYPEISLLRFVVYHRDNFDESSFIGQATFPVSCIRQGIRSIRLKNEYSEYLELATLLVHVKICSIKDETVEKLNDSIELLSLLENNIDEILTRETA